MTPSTRIPEDCPAWLAHMIGTNDQRLASIEATLERFEITLVRLVKRGVSTGNANPGKKTSDKVTFKWLVEKLVVPAMFMLAGYIVARGG